MALTNSCSTEVNPERPARTAVFAHDHRFYLIADKIFSEGKFGDFSQYTGLIDRLTIVAREIRLARPANGISELKNDAVSLLGIPSLASITRPPTLRAILHAVNSSKLAIVRLPSIVGTTVAILAVLRRKPVLVELVGCPWDALRHHSALGRLAAPIAWALTRMIVRRASHVIYVTGCYLQKRYPTTGRSTSISNVFIPPTSNEEAFDIRFNRLRKLSRRIVLGTAAQVDVRYKGQEYVIAALPKLIEMGYDVSYQLAGGGDPSYLESIARAHNVSDRVIFSGRLGRQQMEQWYDSLDIYVQPSLTEGLPRSLIEALSFGLPAVGSSAGGIPELIAPEQIFRPRDESAIAATIATLAESDLARIAESNFKRSMMFRSDLLSERRFSFLADFIESRVEIPPDATLGAVQSSSDEHTHKLRRTP